jgi:riboflavin kinase/FMN adenylyltransferase
MELLAPDRAPLYINTLDQKLGLLKDAGVDFVVVCRFDHAAADLTPEEFVDDVLIGRLGSAAVVVGTNFRFGKKRAGDVETLRSIGSERCFGVVGVEPAVFHGAPVSSTRVRNAIDRGEVDVAAQLLGGPFTMLGRVVPGLGLGRKLGYPTANLDVAPRQIVPPDGVYSVKAVVAGEPFVGACSIGIRPTINGDERSIEVLIDGFNRDIYGEEIGVVFHKKLRDQVRFDSLEDLTAQIGKDIETARRFFR